MSSPLVDEARPLLPDLSADDSESNLERRTSPERGLPKLQIAALLLAYFAETVVAVFAYPFLAQVRSSMNKFRKTRSASPSIADWKARCNTRRQKSGGVFHGDSCQHSTNFLSEICWDALQDSVGHLTTAGAVLLWGRVSDFHGRKPILLACSAGLAVAISCFGFSKTFPALVLSKFLEGVFKANKPTVKTALAELSAGDKHKMARAFALMPAIYAAGSTTGWVSGSRL